MINRREFVALGALSTFAAAGVSRTLAQAWPNRPVRLVVPYAPGGTTDGTARILADRLSRTWGQQVVSRTSRPGTNVGAETVARAIGRYVLVAASCGGEQKSLPRAQAIWSPISPRSVGFSTPVFFVPVHRR